MANNYDFLGSYKYHFTKSSLKAYTDLSGAMQFVGQTNPDFEIDPGSEYVEFYDNTGGTQALYIIASDKVDFKVNFSFMQVFDENVLALALNLDMDNTGANTAYQFIGSEPNELQTAEWRFVGKSLDGRSLTLVSRKGIIINSGSISGSPGSFTNVPISCRFTIDEAITDTKRNLGYFMVEKRQFS